MNERPSIVPFERPAAYWQAKARRHAAPEKRPDAARLLRKAMEKNGDAGTAVALAQVYLDMECVSAAERCLLRASARRGLTGEICCLLGCCALLRGDDVLAADALDACQRLSPSEACADRAQDLLEEMPWPANDAPFRRARGESLARQAQNALAQMDFPRARALAEKAWKRGRPPHAALLQGALRRPREAVPFFRYAVRRLPGDLRARLLFSLVLYHSGQPEAALRELNAACGLCRGLNDIEELCAKAWEMGKNEKERALALVQERLDGAPAGADWLRLKYLCQLHLGQKEKARRTLESLIEIDPEDVSALWYRRHPEDGALYGGRRLVLEVLAAQLYALPERLAYGPLNRTLHGLCFLLRDQLSPAAVYRLMLPAWKNLSRTEKNMLDRGDRHLFFCLGLYTLQQAGLQKEAQERFQALPGKKRVRRTLRRLQRSK